MNLKNLRMNIGKHWLLPILFVLLCLVSGCSIFGRNTVILTTSERYDLIPAGTTYKAKLTKDGPVQNMVREKDAYVVDAGTLIELQEEANIEVLNPAR